MYTTDVMNMTSEEQQQAFKTRCSSDVQFAINSIAAVLSNEETKSAFVSGIEAIAPTVTIPGGVEINSPYKISYKLAPIEERLNISMSGQPNLPPSNYLNLISFNGSEWSGLLTKASQIYKAIPLGLLLTPLAHALFGTKAGPALLIMLLAL